VALSFLRSLFFSRARFVHDVDQGAGVVDRRLWEDAVAEVEDVAGAVGGLV
jgi:hypothetical protein